MADKTKKELQKPIQNTIKETILDNAPVIIAFHDKDHNIIWANEACQKATGLSLQELEGKKCYIAWGLKRLCNNCPVTKAIETGEPHEAELTPQNQEHWPDTQGSWLAKAAPIKDGEGNVIGTVETAFDITERKKAEEILKRERDNLSSIFEVMNDGVYIVNQQYDIQYVNRVLQEEYGSWKGIKCYTYFHDRTEICPWCPNQKVFAGETVRWEWYSKKNGKTYDLIDTPLKGPDGSILKLEIFRDITERKQAEEKLKIKDAAIASSINAIAICDLQGNMEYANNSLITMWGYKNAKEILGKNATEFWQFGKDAEDVIKEEKEKGGWAGELKAKKKDGSFFDVQISASLIKDENGNSVKLMGAFLDITERKHTQDEIVKARDYADNIIKSMFDTLIVINPDGKIRSINKTTAVLLGYKEEELIGKPFGTIVAEEEEEEDIPFIGTRLKKLIKEGFIKEYDMTYKTKSGEMIPVSFSGAVMRDKDGELIGIVCIGRDLRERKKAEDALRESDRKIRAIFDQTFQFIGMMTPDGTLIEANRTAMQFAGIDESDCLGKPFWDTPWWTHSAEMQDKLREAIIKAARGETVCFEATHPAADGSIHYIDFSLKPVKDETGNVIFLIPEGRDITERKKAEKALRESETKLRDQNLTLEQKNLALKEMIEHIERTKNKLKDEIAINLDETVLPILRKLKIKGASPKYVKLLEYHLKELTSSFGRKIALRSTRLTSREIEICNMIKGGLASKDISELLNLSHQTVEKHRKNIRKKLNLSNKKINLTSHLQKI